MPKVRDSSGTIGTTYLPICLSLSSLREQSTKAIVVEASRVAAALGELADIAPAGELRS